MAKEQKNEELWLLEHFESALAVDKASDTLPPLLRLAQLHYLNIELINLLSHFETLAEYCQERIPFRAPYYDIDFVHWAHQLKLKTEAYLASYNLSIAGFAKVSVGYMPLTDGIGLALYDKSETPQQLVQITGNGIKYFPQTEDALGRVGSNKVEKKYVETIMDYAKKTLHISESNLEMFNYGMKTLSENAEKLSSLMLRMNALLHDTSDLMRMRKFLEFVWNKYHEPHHILVGIYEHERSISSSARKRTSTYKKEMMKFLNKKKNLFLKYNKLWLTVDTIFSDEDGNEYDFDEVLNNLSVFVMKHSNSLSDPDLVDLFNYVETKNYIDKLVLEFDEKLKAQECNIPKMMTFEEINELIKQGRVNITQNFNAPVGQVIGSANNVDITKEQ